MNLQRTLKALGGIGGVGLGNYITKMALHPHLFQGQLLVIFVMN